LNHSNQPYKSVMVNAPKNKETRGEVEHLYEKPKGSNWCHRYTKIIIHTKCSLEVGTYDSLDKGDNH
jgi:hypothetical protein